MRISLVLALFLALAAAVAAGPASTDSLPPAFDWTLAPLPLASGVAPRELRTLEGKTALLFYFHPACGHCLEEWPHVMAAARHAPGRGYVVGAIAASSTTRADIEEFGNALGWDFPLWWDSTRAVGKAFGIRSVPRALLVRRDGSVAVFGTLDPARIRMLERLARLDAWR